MAPPPPTLLATPPAVAPPALLAGTFSGSQKLAYGHQEPLGYFVTLDLQQTGASVRGFFTTSGGAVGTVEGTLEGDTVSFSGVQTIPSSARLTGRATVAVVNGRARLEGSATGEDPAYGAFTLTFTASR